MREDYIFKNLVVGMLTRESLKEAFKKRITAKQIIGFIETHAHAQCRNSRAFAQQKKMLLDQQNKAALAKANQAERQALKLGATHKLEQIIDQKNSQISIGNLFGLSNEYGIASVAQQLQIWESEMNCLKIYKGVLIKFENRRQHEDFKNYKDRQGITCWLLCEQWQENRDNVVVIDSKYEKEAIEFINTCDS